MKCEKCKVDISPERLEVLPDTRTCVKCSEVTAPVGIIVWDKNTPILEIMDEFQAVRFRQLVNYDGCNTRL